MREYTSWDTLRHRRCDNAADGKTGSAVRLDLIVPAHWFDRQADGVRITVPECSSRARDDRLEELL